MTKYLVESLGHYGLKKIQPKQKLRIVIFSDFMAKMLEEPAFGKNNGMMRLGLKYEPKIKCQSLKWNCRNILILKMRGEAHSNQLHLKSEELFEFIPSRTVNQAFCLQVMGHLQELCLNKWTDCTS
jgi:hypothetical protein